MKTLISIILLMTILCISGQTYAAWSTDSAVNNAISTAANDQRYPIIVSDGSGGAIITWSDARSGTDSDIYAQRIDANGNVLWTADGVVISAAADSQSSPTIVSDGNGGAIITWYDYRSGTNYDIYAQRINASGVVQWTADGVPISTAANHQLSPTIASDGNSGAIITWYDSRSGNSDIYSQRIGANGNVLWTADGVVISAAANSQSFPTIVSDGSGGAIITWGDSRSGNGDIYAQRIDASGVVQWTTDGVAISTAANSQYYPFIVSDGSNGAIITWRDYRSGNYDIYAQRINASGVVQWTADGVAISTAANGKHSPTIVSDGSGGAIITWYDYRNYNYDIYAQRINASGVVQWTADGVAISTAANSEFSPTIVSDGNGGAIITWYDYRSGTNYDIYAQRINASGVVQWTAGGVAISTAASHQYAPTIVSDGSSGAIITWEDSRSGNFDIYAQRIPARGVLGEDTYTLTVSKSGTGSGTVTSSPSGINCGADCSEIYTNGTLVTLTAMPDTNSTFAGWSGDADCSDGILTMYADKTCTPIFELIGTTNYTLSVSKTGAGSGTVTSSPAGINCGADCSEVYTNGTVVTLTATPNSNSTFAGWSGDADCSDGTITMNVSKNCIATFNSEVNILAIGIPQGTGTGTVTVTPRGDQPVVCITYYLFCEGYSSGTIVTLTATPSANSVFAGWSGDTDCSDGILTMDASKTCTPTFDLGYTLSVSKSGTGSGTVASFPFPSGINCGADCSEVYASGTVVTLIATPDANSAFLGWSGDADCSDGTMTMNSAKNCIATFTELKGLTIGIPQGNGSGTVSVTPRGDNPDLVCAAIYIYCGVYPSGTIVTLTATPSSNSTFAGWSGSADCSDGILFMDAGKTCTPIFNLKTYTLTASVSGNGTVTSAPSGINCPGDCSEVYNPGTSVTLTATTVSGWAFTGWSGACSGTGTCTVTMTADTSVTATFKQTWFEESDPAIAYTGTWSTSSCASCSGGAIKSTSQTRAKADFSFNGTGIRWIATKTSKSGKAKVYIDGIYIATIDLYSKTTQYQVRVFERSGLTPGNHTFRIEYKGDKGTINIDAFEVIL